jgi:hypothetical protein
MARLARIVVPGLRHHVTQRGNRREAIFFEDGDHEVYLDLLAEQALKAGVAVWAYCLMPNHVHLILKPAHADDLGPVPHVSTLRHGSENFHELTAIAIRPASIAQRPPSNATCPAKTAQLSTGIAICPPASCDTLKSYGPHPHPS